MKSHLFSALKLAQMSRRLRIGPRNIPPLSPQEKKKVISPLPLPSPRPATPPRSRISPRQRSPSPSPPQLKASPPQSRASPRRRSPSPRRSPPQSPKQSRRMKELMEEDEFTPDEAKYYVAIEESDFVVLQAALGRDKEYAALLAALKAYLERNLLTLAQMRFFTTVDEKKYEMEADQLRNLVGGWMYLWEYWQTGMKDADTQQVFDYLTEMWKDISPEEPHEQLADLVIGLPKKFTERDVPFFKGIQPIFAFEAREGDTSGSDDLLEIVKERAATPKVYREIEQALRS